MMIIFTLYSVLHILSTDIDWIFLFVILDYIMLQAALKCHYPARKVGYV